LEVARNKEWDVRTVIVLGVLTLLTALARGVRIGVPAFPYFDELIYRKDACQYLPLPGAGCTLPYAPTEVHPPLGKWLMAAGMRIFGDGPLGWRSAAVLAGVLSVAVLFILARRFMGLLPATVAAFLWGLDPMHLTMSRIGMLEIYVPLFGLLAILCLVYATDNRDRQRWGLWLLAGMSLGGSVATKWSGIFYVLLGLTYLLHIGQAEARQGQALHPFDHAIRRYGGYALLFLVAVPLSVYVLSFAGRLDRTRSAPGEQTWVQAFMEEQSSMLRTHINLPGTNDLTSPAIGWPVGHGGFPMVDAEGREKAQVNLASNPTLWVSGLSALLYIAITKLRSSAGGYLALAGFAWSYFPWLALFLIQEATMGTHRQAIYMYYYLPALGFLYLGLGAVLSSLQGKRQLILASALCVYGLATTVFLYPQLTYA